VGYTAFERVEFLDTLQVALAFREAACCSESPPCTYMTGLGPSEQVSGKQCDPVAVVPSRGWVVQEVHKYRRTPGGFTYRGWCPAPAAGTVDPFRLAIIQVL
jgi:hypothetical protein